MFPLRKPIVVLVPDVDRFRGTSHRWRIDHGPLAGTSLDHAFHADWSLSWRVVAGPNQGRVGRSREFLVEAVRADVHLLCYAVAATETLAMTLDFANGRLRGFKLVDGTVLPIGGSFQLL